MKISISSLDKLFSRYVRLRAKGICEICRKPREYNSLQCCHFHGRRKKSVRFDPDNALAADFGCHRWLDENPIEKTEFWKKRLGEAAYKKLNLRAAIPQRPDEKAIEIWLKQEITKL